MDLLGYIRQEAGDKETAYRASAHGTYRGNAQALLLDRLYSSFKVKIIITLLIAVGYGYRIFTIHREKIGEISFYKDANMELKVVLIHENIPFSYVGNSYSVACQSQNTKSSDLNDEAEWKSHLIEKGW